MNKNYVINNNIMKKYCFILDTGSSYELVNGQDDTFVVPIQIVEKNKKGETNTFEDGINFFENSLEEAFANGHDVSTAQPNVAKAEELVKECLQSYEKVIFIPLSKEISGFYNSMKNLEKKYPDLIVVDSQTMGIGGNWIKENIDKALKNDEIKLNSKAINEFVLEKNKKWCGSLIVADLSCLSKSGRISKFKAMLGNLLKLKVLIKFDGPLTYESKDMNIEVSVSKALKMIDNKINFSKNGISRITIMGELNDEKMNKKLIEFITKKLNVETFIVSKLPTPIKVCTGLNTFSIIIESK